MLNVMILNDILNNSEVIEMEMAMILASEISICDNRIELAASEELAWRSHDNSDLPSLESAEHCVVLPHPSDSLLYSDSPSWKGRCTTT